MKIAVVGFDAERVNGKAHIIENVTRELKKLVHAQGIVNGNSFMSGHSPKGGVDIIIEQLANENNVPFTPYPPHHQHWDMRTCGQDYCPGYKARNMTIAQSCDKLYCYAIENKDAYCYHCKVKGHEPGGACYTMMRSKELGKEVHLVVVSNQRLE